MLFVNVCVYIYIYICIYTYLDLNVHCKRSMPEHLQHFARLNRQTLAV